ncbi:PD-(D/E)XK nuclease family protein [Fundidesulfovibrio terrae]|uniref:PD-(D/E)XK nuclease family protein n=1 Tax=Fundidesulfovibrio terrae TaxID=2922866 RepID=UPI001FB0146A|nr:PD-(D/E)XK nuclease family protein [Fundidesulfovibrio terrae]
MLTLSKTRINTYLGCSEKYRLHYELGLRPLKRAKSLVEGSAIHHQVQCGLLYRDSPPVDVLEHASRSFWEENTIELCDYTDEGEYLKAQARCLAESKAFLEQLGPLPVSQVELKLSSPLIHPITLVEHPEINQLGYIDLLIHTDTKGSFCIADLKTAAKTPHEGLGRLAMELTFYAYLYSQPFTPETSQTNSPVALIHLVRTKEPKVIWDEGRRSLPDFLELYRLCRKVAADIKAGHFWPCPGVHCGWCEYESLCFMHDEKAVQTFGERHWLLYHQDLKERRVVKIPLKSVVGF